MQMPAAIAIARRATVSASSPSIPISARAAASA
jgi:hypothetical protein